MIKSYTAYTQEMDDAEAAVSEILKQLEPEKNCLKSTVALVTCYHEYVTNGIITELSKKLAFPIIGTTTALLATNHHVGQIDCAILMITSDDVTFTAACSSSLSHGLEAPLVQMYQSALAGHSEPPKLILSAAPFSFDHTAENCVDILNRASGGIPNFGALVVDDSLNCEHSHVIFNEKFKKDIYSVILASGNIEPHFLYASFSPKYILPQTAAITWAEGNLIKEVNGLPLINYLETLGLVSNGQVRHMLQSVPLILDYAGEGIPISRAMDWHEDGYGMCTGLIPAGTQLSIGIWDKSEVISTTTHTIGRIMSLKKNISTLLLYSCLARICALGPDVLLEATTVNETIADRVPYLFAYSGGEICPVSGKATTNRFHNNTIIACAF
jgi:hypothetical protein